MRGHYPRLFGRAAVGLALAMLAGGAHASASSSIRPAPGTPDPRSMVLTSADLGGAKVTRQGYYKDKDFPSAVSYTREFDKGHSRGTQLLYASSDAEVGIDEATTSRYLGVVRKVLGTRQGRKLIADSFGDALGAASLLSTIDVGRPRNLGAGAGSFDVLVTVRVLGVRTQLHLAVFSLERVLGEVSTAGMPGRVVSLSVMTRLAKTMQQRMAAELFPRNLSAPTITGTPQAGQTLTANPGTWGGAETTFTYQWQSCDAAGATCTDLRAECSPSGAVCSTLPTVTSQSYVPTWLDAAKGATIRVAVTAHNAVGMASAVSAPTAVVTAAPKSLWPTSTSPPTITGNLHVGETLTASSGGWNGNPTSFTYRWFRCDTTSTPRCLPIASEATNYAGGPTYVLSPADSGMAVQLCITAYNAAGGGVACSARTAQIA